LAISGTSEIGSCVRSASLKTFDASGNPKVHEQHSALMKRTASYEDLNTLNRLDLKQLFVEYLKKSGRQDLLPN
jgi:hypothetical protein